MSMPAFKLPLTLAERQNIHNGPRFCKLSPAPQQDILTRASVRRLADGQLAGTRGAKAEEWCGVALSALRVEPSRLIVLSREKLLALSEVH
jgi:hypothetical protein